MLRAPWLGHWKPPWGLDQGRRWGDTAWALAAVSQAWLLGGHEGRWPRLVQAARRPGGPRVLAAPEAWQARPDPAWVALLRHGSAGVPAGRRGPAEDELLAWAWEALLEGDGAPWMAVGTVRVPLDRRRALVAVLGAVDEGGGLVLPPWLDLVPGDLRALPPGWWEHLLAGQAPDGRLLPEGVLDPALPWPLLQRVAEPLALVPWPDGLPPPGSVPWAHPLPGGGVLDPSLRGWARGWGASPGGLAGLRAPGLAWGDPAEPDLGAVLALALPGTPPPGWTPALAADLAEARPRPAPPAPCGHPAWDRLRMRWAPEPAAPAPGYPAWGTRAHPCADPFHWMAQGLQSLRAYDAEGALRAFTLAHAHFRRLQAPGWASRAASNAAVAALQWADLPAHGRWAALRGTLPQPWRDMEAAQLAEIHQGPEEALARLRALVADHPDFPEAWGLLASHGADRERWDLVREGLVGAGDHPYTRFLAAALGSLDAPPQEGLDPESRVSWEAHRLFRGGREPGAFWRAWEACPTQIMRLELGLQVLERRPDQRRVEPLLALQAIADRARSPRHQARVAALWPPADPGPEPIPRSFLEAVLAARSAPAWVAWADRGTLQTLGRGDAPPEGALSRLVQEGSLPPVVQGPWLWQGHPLRWDGLMVGAVLLAHPVGTLPEPPLEPGLLAPWVARLRAAQPPPPVQDPGALLTDGSEPMAAVLQELDRVAPTPLPVLILGPSGSGKELAAQELHRRSGRAGTLVAVNCAAFAEGLLESELFGHVKGAFTGADRDRRGALETARGGTLLLDEVADLSPRLQSLLLRVIQEREIRRVGSDQAVKVDVRFAAATHRDLEALAVRGDFRRDLLFRLQGAILRLPPLSARRHEFPTLVPHLVRRAAATLGRPAPALAPGLAEALARAPWPGNVRELLHALERGLLRCGEGPLGPSHLPEAAAESPGQRWDEATRAFQREHLRATLLAHGHCVADAARALGLARPALYATARRLGLELVAERLQRAD